MAKAKRRGNREIRKPKANKLVAVSVPASLSIKGLVATKSIPKKKS